MRLFGKKKAETAACCGGQNAAPACADGLETAKNAGIKVLGAGCAKCRALEEAVSSALRELGMEDTIVHVTDSVQIAACGVISTPALMVDGTVVSYGRVLNKEEAKDLIRKARGGA